MTNSSSLCLGVFAKFNTSNFYYLLFYYQNNLYSKFAIINDDVIKLVTNKWIIMNRQNAEEKHKVLMLSEKLLKAHQHECKSSNCGNTLKHQDFVRHCQNWRERCGFKEVENSKGSYNDLEIATNMLFLQEQGRGTPISGTIFTV